MLQKREDPREAIQLHTDIAALSYQHCQLRLNAGYLHSDEFDGKTNHSRIELLTTDFAQGRFVHLSRQNSLPATYPLSIIKATIGISILFEYMVNVGIISV